MIKLEESLLKKYAQVMVHYALNNGKGINKGDTVFLVGQECTKDLFLAIAREVYAAGGNLITNYQPDEGMAEYATTFTLPPGCWVSDYYLYVGSKKEKGRGDFKTNHSKAFDSKTRRN